MEKIDDEYNGQQVYRNERREKCIKKECEMCGDIYLASIYKIKKGTTSTCSRSCAVRKGNQNQEGENNPNWKGGISDDAYRYTKKSKARYPEKRKARSKLRYAVKSGNIERKPCEICGSENNIEGHHPDYNQPLDVVWLCKTHHKQYHDGKIELPSQTT